MLYYWHSNYCKIEIWDAQVGRRHHVIQTQSANPNERPVAFSPRGEPIVSSSQDGIIIVDLESGVLRSTTSPFVKGQGLNESQNFDVRWARTSFDPSRLAALLVAPTSGFGTFPAVPFSMHFMGGTFIRTISMVMNISLLQGPHGPPQVFEH